MHWTSILQRIDSHAAVRPILNLTPELATAILPAGHGQKEQWRGTHSDGMLGRGQGAGIKK